MAGFADLLRELFGSDLGESLRRPVGSIRPPYEESLRRPIGSIRPDPRRDPRSVSPGSPFPDMGRLPVQPIRPVVDSIRGGGGVRTGDSYEPTWYMPGAELPPYVPLGHNPFGQMPKATPETTKPVKPAKKPR